MSLVVLLPGLICDDSVWREQIKMLNSLGHETLVMDWGELNDLTEMASLTLEQASGEFGLIGHSMGGRVALEIMRQAPERITALMLMDTGYQSLAEGEAGQREVDGRMALLKIAEAAGMRPMGERWMQGMVLPEHLGNTELCKEILDMIERKSSTEFANQLHALIHRPDASDVLRSLTVPTWLVCGDQDAWSPLDRHYAMAELISGAQVIAIEDSGHMSTMEQPERVNQVICSWLKYL